MTGLDYDWIVEPRTAAAPVFYAQSQQARGYLILCKLYSSDARITYTTLEPSTHDDADRLERELQRVGFTVARRIGVNL